MAVTAFRRKARYTNTDIADLVMEVHACLHTVEGKVDKIKSDVGEIGQRVARVEGHQEGMANRFNLPTAPEPRSFVQRNKTPIIAVGATLGTIASFVAAYPLIRVVFLAMDAYLVKTGAK